MVAGVASEASTLMARQVIAVRNYIAEVKRKMQKQVETDIKDKLNPCRSFPRDIYRILSNNNFT